MNQLNIVLGKLVEEEYNAVIETEIINGEKWSKIGWTNESGVEFFIYQDDIAIAGDKIAWFQSSSKDHHLLKIYVNDLFLSWEPKTYNPFFGCYCLLLEWYKDHLIFIYQEKHCIYICAIKDGNVKYFNFHGEEIERKGDLVAYKSYMDELPGMVRLIQLPDLTVLEPVSQAEAENRGLLPEGLNRPGNFLAFKPDQE